MRRFPSPPVHATLMTALGIALAGCSSAGDGGTGDPPAMPLADPCGHGDRISTIIGPATWACKPGGDVCTEDTECCSGICKDDGMGLRCDPAETGNLNCKTPPDRTTHVTGVTVLAIDNFDETGFGARGNFYVQDCATPDPVPFSGVTVYNPSFSPPDLRLSPGDVADVLGVFTEFPGPPSSEFRYCRTLPEISGTLSFRYDSGTMQPPKVIDVTDLATYATARQWLGMLVRIENVRITENPFTPQNPMETPCTGRCTVRIDAGTSPAMAPGISNELYDLNALGPPLPPGATISAVTGIVTYFYSFRIAPRSPADIEP